MWNVSGNTVTLDPKLVLSTGTVASTILSTISSRVGVSLTAIGTNGPGLGTLTPTAWVPILLPNGTTGYVPVWV